MSAVTVPTTMEANTHNTPNFLLEQARKDGWSEGRFGNTPAPCMDTLKLYENDVHARLAFWRAHREGNVIRNLLATT